MGVLKGLNSFKLISFYTVDWLLWTDSLINTKLKSIILEELKQTALIMSC